MTKTMLACLMALMLALSACSDDNDTNADQGVGQDMAIDMPGTGDQGPGAEAGADAAADAAQAKKVEAYIPADNDVPGWTEDTTKGKPGVEAAYDKKGIEDLINGKHDPYHAEGTDGFAMEHYKKDFGGGCTGTIKFMMWDMTKAASAKKMFEKAKKDGETMAGLTFEEIKSVKDRGIIAFDAVFEAHAYKNDYVMILTAMPTGDAACKSSVKADVIKFLEKVTTSLP